MGWFHDAELKIERAREHLHVLNDLIASYFASKPYAAVREYDPFGVDPGGFHWRGVSIQEPPEHFALVVGDCAQNLRAALDYVAHDLVKAYRSEPSARTSFPIFISEERYRELLANGRIDLGNIPPDMLATIDGLQPYRRGDGAADHPLWLLQQLANIDKHRRLHVTSVHVLDTERLDWSVPIEIFLRTGGSAPSSAQREAVMPTFWFKSGVPSSTDMDVYLQGSLFVMLQEEGSLGRAPVQYLLQQLIDFVEGTALPSLLGTWPLSPDGLSSHGIVTG